MSVSTEQILGQLNQARDIAFGNKEMFPQVVKQIFNFANNEDLALRRWAANFLFDAFSADDSFVGGNVKTELAMDAVDSLLIFSEVKDIAVFKSTVNTSVVVFKLLFQFIAANDGANQLWFKLSELKKSIINKFSTTFPLEPSDNEEHDMLRSIDPKLEIIRFIVVVVDLQSRTSRDNSFSLANVSPNHSLIRPNLMEAESAGFVDLLLSLFASEILVPQLLTATLNHLIVIVKRKQQFSSKIFQSIDKFDTHTKLQSNYQSLEQFKLARKYVDRVLKVFINHSLRTDLVPPSFQLSLNRKLNLLNDRGVEVRKLNILAIEDSGIKKRKFEGFYNASKKLKTVDYKNLYSLIDPADALNQFDVSSLAPHILVSVTLSVLKRVKASRLAKALEIISERYLDALQNNPVSAPVKKSGKNDDEDDDDEREDIYEPKTVYTLPPPKDLSFQEKRDHLAIIILNFFKLAEGKTPDVSNERGSAQNELTKVAIKAWNKDSWVILLTRLATRGMRTVTDEYSPDFKQNQDLSDMVRTAIFDYFLRDIHNRVDVVLEWLNEEWYSERVLNENKLTEELSQKYLDQNQLDEELLKLEIPTPTYDLWTGKVLDSMIPFLEPTDRKIFIRLLSDLPVLNEELVGRVKSLCLDPARSKMGFLALQYLIMYRPPVKQACFTILKNLQQSEDEDLKEEALKLLKKYGEI